MVKVLLFLVLLIPFVTNGQKLCGHVLNSKNNPIELSNILIKSNLDSSILNFTSTDVKGFFNIIIDNPNSFLEVLAFGYENFTGVINPKDTILVVVLQEKKEMLEEVTVVGRKPPYVLKKDTVLYDVKQYLKGNEKNLEDLLKKLPGISVSEDGTITSKGKSIDKIMIEGEEFLGKNYKLISKSVSPNLISKIESIDHFNDEKQLKNFQKSNKIVLNLILEDSAKLKPSGMYEIGLANEKRWNANLNIFNFNKKVNQGLLIQSNSIGNDNLENITYNLDGQSEKYGSLPPMYQPNQWLFSGVIASVPNIQPERYRFNKSIFGGNNISLKLSKKITFNTYQIAGFERLNIENTFSQTFSFKEGQFSFQDSLKQSSKTRRLNVMSAFNINHNQNTTSKISYLLTLPISETASRISSSMNNNEPLNVITTQKRSNHAVNYRLLHNFSEKLLLVSNLSYGYTVQPELIQLWNSNESNSILNKYIVSEISLKKIVNRWRFNYDILSSINKQELNQNRNESYKIKIKALNPKFGLSYESGKIFFLAEVGTQSMLVEPKKQLTKLIGNAGIKWIIDDKSQVKLTSASLVGIPQFTKFSGKTFYTNYRTITEGNSPWLATRYQLANLNITHYNFERQITFIADINRIVSTDNIVPNITSIEETIFQNYKIFNKPIEDNTALVSLSSNLLRIRSNFKIEALVQTQKNSFYINNQLQSNLTLRYFGKLTINTNFRTALNIFPGVYFTYLKNSSQTNPFYQTRPYAIMSYNKKYYNAELKYEMQKWNNSNVQLHFLDAVIKLNPVKTKFKFEVNCKNLLNNKTLVYNSIDLLFQSQQTYNLQPRMIMISTIKNF